MQDLDRETLNELVELLIPLMGNEQQRRALLTSAFLGYSPGLLDIFDYSGSTNSFTVNLIRSLMDYGEVEGGESALEALLKTCRNYVGRDKQRRIDALMDVISTSPKITTISPAEQAISALYSFEDFSELLHDWKIISGEIGQIDTGNFARGVTNFTRAFCELLQLRRPPERPLTYKNAHGFVLDVSPLVMSTRLPTELPILFLHQDMLHEEDLMDLVYLIKERLKVQSHSVLLILFADRGVVQEAQRLVDRLRSSYAYDIIVMGSDELRQVVFASEPQRMLRNLLLRNINLMTVAPFVTMGPTPVTMFFGREVEMLNIVQHAKTKSYSILGGRLYGKTSTLTCLHQVRLPAAGFYALYLDCQPISTYGDLLNTPIYAWEPGAPLRDLSTCGDLLKAPPIDKFIVVLLDEVDDLVWADQKDNWRLFKTLRALSNSGHMQFVFSGERTLREAIRDSKGPLYNFANEIALGPLDFRAAEELILRPMKQLEIELVNEPEIIHQIYDFTFGHPNIVQRLCSRLIERLNQYKTRRITLDDVAAVINDPTFQENDFLEIYWWQATPLERIISLLMAQQAKPYRLQAVLDLLETQDLYPDPRVVKAALDRLVGLRSILKRNQNGYEFAVKSFSQVISNTTTAEDLLITLKSEYQENPMETAE